MRVRSAFIASLAFVVPGFVYWATLAPDITWAYQGADGGDLITAAYTLGVPHPSGYPTYVLVGWLISKLPAGTIAWRFNLLSAISMAGAAWLIFNSLYTLNRSRPAALVSAWTFAFIPLVWSQAIITEVYGLNVFFVALLIWLGLQIRLGRRQVAFYFGLTFGLALGTHLTVLLLLPLLVWMFHKHWSSIRFATIAGLLGGLLIFSYLPLRAGRGPITWGRPDTLLGFFALIFGQIYRGYLFDLPLNALGPRILALAGYLSEMGVVVVTLLGLGVWWAWRNARTPLYWAIASAVCYITYATGYRTADSFVYLLPVFVLAALGVGLGTDDVISKLPSGTWRTVIGATVFSAPLILGSMNIQRLSLRDDQVAQRFWQTILTQAPPKAILLTDQDNHTFTLWYAQHVLDYRTDVALVDKGLLSYSWYREDLQRSYPWLTDLQNLANLFQKRADYPQPLCAISMTEQGDQWLLDCLTPLSK